MFLLSKLVIYHMHYCKLGVPLIQWHWRNCFDNQKLSSKALIQMLIRNPARRWCVSSLPPSHNYCYKRVLWKHSGKPQWNAKKWMIKT